ncbi:MAG: hypothetical protein JSV27_12290 [Candidatus Bathyarchaeota archaeon]|nr:MAG: hypothetical protein JSV27_12290 [Candidatus Bathyarchaeota archaeon]
MSITATSLIEKRKGVSTILGTLIFIGIIFTSVVPMLLVMKQADTIYMKKIHDVENMDNDRASEDLIVYLYDGGNTSVNVKVKNMGETPVKIIRVWTNDKYHNENTTILTNSEEVLGPFEVPDVAENVTVDASVVTERGNIFYSISGSLYFSGGGWSTTSYGICVIIHNPGGGEFKVSLWNVSRYPDQWDEFYESKAKEWEDIVATTPVLEPSADYKIDVKEKKGSKWKSLPGSPIATPIEYPNGPPFILVWMDAQ